MLRGWKEIEEYTRMYREKLKELHETKGLPLKWIGRDPFLDEKDFDEWYRDLPPNNHVKTP